MAAIVSHIDIARPAAEVFAYITDPHRFAEWQSGVVSAAVDRPAGKPAAEGTRFTTTRRIGGSERTMTQEITELDPPRSWAAHGIDGPVRPDATITVEPLDGNAGVHVTFTLEFTWHGIGKALVPVVRKMAEREVPQSFQNLKHILERRSADGNVRRGQAA